MTILVTYDIITKMYHKFQVGLEKVLCAKLCFYLQITFCYQNNIFHLLCPISRGVRAAEITQEEGSFHSIVAAISFYEIEL